MEGRAKKTTIVHCAIHGKDSGGDFRWLGKALVVTESKGKKDRRESGCPHCRRDVALGTGQAAGGVA